MSWALCRLFVSTLTFHVVVGLTQSDGYNIGVVLGSILGALIAVGIAAFVFYMLCIRRWLGVGEPAELGYSRQNDYNSKKQVGGASKFGGGRYGVQGKAPPYSGPRDAGRRQGAANDVYQHDDHSRPQQQFQGSAARYEGDGGGGPAVVLSGGGSDHQLRQHSPNVSYSSEEVRGITGAGRPGYEVTTTRNYQQQQRGFTQPSSAAGGGAGGSPISAAYLGTGV